MKRLQQIFKAGAISSLTILFLLLCSTASQVSAQNCGWDSHYGEQLKQPAFLKHMQGLIQRSELKAKSFGGGSDLTEVVIPIVFHVVHKGTSVGTGDNFLYTDVMDALARLNSDFNGSGISFCPALRDEEGNQLEEAGVVRVNASGNTEYMNSGITIGTQVEFDVKALGQQFSNYNYCNVWVVSNILGINVNGQIQGFASFPNTVNASVDGIMIRSAIFNQATNRVMTHEAGHYLGLFHTFTGDDPDYDGANFVCPADAPFPLGDGIGDTQPHIRSASGSCPSGTNPCPTGGMLEDISNNHMDYSGESCRNNFTEKQMGRMLETVDCHRKGLIHSLGCEPGCNPVFVVDYSNSPTNPLANDSDDPINNPGDLTVFSNNSNSSSYTWYVNGVLQTVTNTDLSIVFENAGDHTVCLVETDQSCTIETCKTIRVFSQGTCQDMTLPSCELLLNGDFSQFNENEIIFGSNGMPIQGQYIDYESANTNYTNKICNWVNKGGTPTAALMDNDELAIYMSAFLPNSTNSNNTDIISTIFPLGLIHGAQYNLTLKWKPWRPSLGTGWGTRTILNIGLANDPFNFNDRNTIHSTDQAPLAISDATDPDGFTDVSITFIHDENNGNFLCFWSDELDGIALNSIRDISVDRCNVCAAEPSYTYNNDCGSFSFNGVDGNPNSNGIISWSIDGVTLAETTGQEDFDFNFPYEDHYEVCMNITCPYGGTVQYCETVFAGGTSPEGFACEICQNPETINVSAQRCDDESNEFLVDPFTIVVPKGFKPCLGNFDLIQSNNGTVIPNDFYIDESGPTEDVIHVSFTFLADDPTAEMSAILGLCGPNGETLCFQFIIVNPTTCDSCEEPRDLLTNLHVECDDDNLGDGVQEYSGSFTINLDAVKFSFCGFNSTNSGFSTQNVSVNVDGTQNFDFTVSTNQEGAFNVQFTLCFMVLSGDEFIRSCFTFTIAIDDPCPTESACIFVANQTPITCDNVKEGLANYVLQSSFGSSSLIEQGFVWCEENPITSDYFTIEPVTGIGITAYLFRVELAVPCDVVANDGSTIITLNLCNPNGETVCIDLEFQLECDECPSTCEFVANATPISCTNVQDGVANYSLQSSFGSSSLIEQGFVWCEDNPISGDYITGTPSTGTGITAYLFSVDFAVPCDEVANVGSTTITLNLCNPNGETVCVELEFQLECDDCVACDETLSTYTIRCSSIKDGVASFNFNYLYANTLLQQSGYQFCSPDGVVSDHLVGQPFTKIGINGYIIGVQLEMSCQEIADGGETSVTMYLCNVYGDIYCVEIPLILACEDCGDDKDGKGGKITDRNHSENNYKLYPNPSSGNVYIIAPPSSFEQSYEVYDISGKLVITGKLLQGSNLINLENSLNGLYYIQIKNGMELFQQKIVVID